MIPKIQTHIIQRLLDKITCLILFYDVTYLKHAYLPAEDFIRNFS